MVDSINGKVLTVAYMNKESLKISIEKRLTCFWSRSRQKLWLKGETSGNYQHIVSITADCDKDALTVAVEKDGPACHNGTDSCFTFPVWKNDELNEFSLTDFISFLREEKRINRRDRILHISLKKVLIKFLKRSEKKVLK